MSNHTQETLTSMLEIIDRQVTSASVAIHAAKAAARRGSLNEAIGSLMPTETYLRTALDLYRATLAMHRTPLAGEDGGAS